MTNQSHKIEIIRSIEHLQLSTTLIDALDDAQTACSVVNAVNELIRYNQHWY